MMEIAGKTTGGVTGSLKVGLTLVEEVKLVSGTSYTFNNVNGTKFRIIVAGVPTAGTYVGIRFNGISSNTYTSGFILVAGTNVSGGFPAATSEFTTHGGVTNEYSIATIDLMCAGGYVAFNGLSTDRGANEIAVVSGYNTTTPVTEINQIYVHVGSGTFTGTITLYKYE